MTEKPYYGSCLMVFQKVVLFQYAPVRFNYVAFSQILPLFTTHKPVHVLTCGRINESAGVGKLHKFLGVFQVAGVTEKASFQVLRHLFNHFAVSSPVNALCKIAAFFMNEIADFS